MKHLILFFILLIFTNIVNSATNGSFNSSSSFGTFVINVSKGDAVKITRMSDLVISNNGIGVADVIINHEICYFATSNNYKLDITTNNNYQLVHSGSNPKKMNYTIEYDNDKNGTIDWIFSDISNTNIFSNNNKISENCNGGTNARFTIRITNSQYKNKPINIYTDIVTMIITIQ